MSISLFYNNYYYCVYHLYQVNAKLSDYGISTYATEGGLREDIGTSGYKAPELLKAKRSKMPYDNKA